MEGIAAAVAALLGVSVCLQAATLCVLLSSRRAASGPGAAIATAVRQVTALALPAVVGALLGRCVGRDMAGIGELARAAGAEELVKNGVFTGPDFSEPTTAREPRDHTAGGVGVCRRVFQATGDAGVPP